jgi:20S proteasome subunit alpha 3
MGLDESLGLALKVLSKTMDSTTLDSEKRELSRRYIFPEGFEARLARLTLVTTLTFGPLGLAVELATLTVDSVTGLPKAHIFKPAEIDAREWY